MISQTLRRHTAYSVAGLRFRYGGDRRRERGQWVVNGLTFDVDHGTTLGIIGPNGSGKTSLLKLLGRLLPLQQGHIRVLGQDLMSMSQVAVARTIAYVPQDSLYIFPFTIAETVLMGRFPHRQPARFGVGFGWEDERDIRLAEEAMSTMDVLHLRGRPINEVSGGERQRALIARALTQEPQILLLDEPTAFLDLNHQLEICRVLRRLNREQGLTVVLVSHDLNLASQYCDMLLLLKDGVIVSMGTPADVIRPEVLQTVYGCQVLVDSHPTGGSPRVTLPGPGQCGEPGSSGRGCSPPGNRTERG